MDDFQGHEGCNEILNVTRPDIVRGVHDAYFEVGVDCVETNTFGANLANLGEYDISDRIYELAAGRRPDRRARPPTAWSTADQPRFVIGSVGPGTKLPSLGHAPYAALRDAYQSRPRGMVDGGADAILIETAQDLLQAKAAVIGARRALADAGEDLPVMVQVTVETTGHDAARLRDRCGPDGAGAAGHRRDRAQLRHRPGRDERAPAPPLAPRPRSPSPACPTPACRMLTRDGAALPAHARGARRRARPSSSREFGLSLVGGCCGTTPEHLAAVVEAVGGQPVQPRRPRPEHGVAVALLSTCRSARTPSYLSIGERTNANGSKAFREAMLESRWDDCVEIARDQTRDGAHLLDVCVDYVGRDGAEDMREVVGRFATVRTLPLVLDSTEPPVIEAGLELLGGRAVINSVNYEDGDGPDSRFARIMPVVREHGAAVVALTIDE